MTCPIAQVCPTVSGTYMTASAIVNSLTLFVFLTGGLNQNVNSLSTHVSDTGFHALSYGSLHFVLHAGSLINHLFQRFSFAVEQNQPIKKWLKKLPWRRYRVKEHQKMIQKLVSKMTLNFVRSHL